MSGNVTKLRPKQEEAIVALLSNRSVEDAARAVKTAPRTLYRSLNEPQFDKAYRKARRAAFGHSTARLQQASGAAVSAVLKVMVDPGTSGSTRLRAADIVLAHAAKAIEIEDIEARVTETGAITRRIEVGTGSVASATTDPSAAQNPGTAAPEDCGPSQGSAARLAR